MGERNIRELNDADLIEELLSARNLALWAIRNDEGIVHDQIYRLFHNRLRALEKEVMRRNLHKYVR